jgi:hypothetical protein
MSDVTTLPFEDIPEPLVSGAHGSSRVSHGRQFVPQQQILLYEAGEWEGFIQEWAHSQKSNYTKVSKFSGTNDMGIDIAGFTDTNGLSGIWDNFQCKHYKDPLTPSVAIVEIGKIIWYSFNKHYAPPRKFYFVAPQDCGLKLKKMLGDASLLRSFVLTNWDKNCSEAITETTKINLSGDFKLYAEDFDYTIFDCKASLDIIEDHRKTPWFAIRFGGGLPDRPPVTPPPTEISSSESRYISQLFEAYSDHKKAELAALSDLSAWTELGEHYHRQRELFYNAEALRNFARDTVPPGTFEDLQNEVHAGVIDIEASTHVDAFIRLNAVTMGAASLQMTSNALISVVKIQDKKGICHQLANENRLIWKKT